MRVHRVSSSYQIGILHEIFITQRFFWVPQFMEPPKPIGSMYAIYGNIYHQYTPNVSIYTIHGSYGKWIQMGNVPGVMWVFSGARAYYGATTRSCYMAMATWWGTTRCRRTRGSWDHVENEWEDKQQSWMIMDEFNIIIYIYIYIRLNKYDIYFIHFCFFYNVKWGYTFTSCYFT